MSFHVLSKFRSILVLSYKSHVIYFADTLGINITFLLRISIILILYKGIYATAGSQLINGYTLSQLSCALIFAQALSVSRGRIEREMDQDIKSGKIAIFLLNPISYIWFKFFEHFAKSFINGFISLGLGLLFGFLLIPHFQISIAGLFIGMILLMLGMAIIFFAQMTIGLIAFFTEDASPFHRIWGRFVMLFGGNILPIPFLPGWLQSIAMISPFFYMGYGAGLVVSNFDIMLSIKYIAIHIMWTLIFIGMAHLIFYFGQKKLEINGG